MRFKLALPILVILFSSFFIFRKKNPEKLQAAKIELGRQLFFDKALSNPNGQSCTVCHAPKTAFSDPNHVIVSEGMIDGAFVSRNSQSLTYVAFIPPRHFDESTNRWKGGLFWDGRSDQLEHQLAGPLFNPAEMNNADTASLIDEVMNAPYYKMYRNIYGKVKDKTIAYQNICESLSAFERSETLNEFSSKYDLSLQGKVTLSELEQTGLTLFEGKANCVSCHTMTPDPITGKILFSDYSYHNVGVPANSENPFYSTDPKLNPRGDEYVDLGLGGVTWKKEDYGKFRTPTLRNVQYTGPYFHNGYFKTLKEAVHFMNARNNGTFAQPEITDNIARQLTGSQNLTAEEELAVVAFLLTLTDGYDEE
jgi:cytochrome c peroxidase